MIQHARPSNRSFAVSLALILALMAAFSLVAAQAAHALPCRDCGPNGDDTSGGGTGTGTANTPPTASFTVSPSSPTAGQLVTFSSTSTDEENNISRYEWDLDGDGLFETKTTDPSATKTYMSPGTFTVSMRAFDSGGKSDTAQTVVSVTAPSGGGGNTGSGGGGGEGDVASTPPPTGSDAPGCESRIQFRQVEVVGECLRRDGNIYTSTRPLRANGIDMRPVTGKITIYQDSGIFDGKVKVGLGNLTLYEGDIFWDFDDVIEFDSAKNVLLNGFGINGGIKLTPGGDRRSELRVNVKVDALSKQFGGATGQTTLVTDNENGLHLGSLKVVVDQALLGPIEVKNVVLEYESDLDRWYGQATVFLPTPEPRVRIDANASFVGGQFQSANAVVDNLNAPIGPGAELQRISFSIELKPNLTLEGGVRIAAGPRAASGKRMVLIDGKLKMIFGDPTIIRADGVLYVAGFQLANGYVEYRSSGYFGVGASTQLWLNTAHTIGAQGKLDGWVDRDKAFNIEGSVVVRIYDWKLAGEALISSRGMAACGHAGAGVFGTINLGFGYGWESRNLEIMGASCDVGRYRAVSSVARAGGVEHAKVPAHLPVATFAVQGADGAPKVKVSGPKGESSISPDTLGKTQSGNFLFFRNAKDNTTYVAVAKPSAGDWRVEAVPGSSRIVSFRQANGLPETSVHAKVTGAGATRTLAYTVKQIPGQEVSFVEEGKGTTRILGSAHGARGKLRFKPAEGTSSRRKITAVIEQDGMVREQVAVSTYKPPKPVKPGKVGRLKVRRAKSALLVSWRPTHGATRYAVHVKRGNGQSTTVIVTGHSAKVADVPADEAATVFVAGLSKSGELGPKAKVHVKRARTRAAS